MSLPLKWEFPGGKFEENESGEETLLRELKEELNISVEIKQKLTPVEHHYDTFSIRLHPFICTYIEGELKMLEHKEIRWVAKEELKEFDWAEADKPIVKEFLEVWK